MAFAIHNPSTDLPLFQGVPADAPPNGVARRGQAPKHRPDVLTHAHISPQQQVKAYSDYGRRLKAAYELGQRRFAGGPGGITPPQHRKPTDAPKAAHPSGGKMQFWVDGSLVKVSKPAGSCNHSGGGKRSVILGFSRGARRRILQKLAMLIRTVLPLFVTLTYPADFPVDYTQWKRHLDSWCKRLHRRFPTAGLIWRLEAQKRGAPHYHMLIFGVDLTPEVRQWIAQSWFDVVASGDSRHLAHGTDCQAVRSARGVRAYVGKYIAKVQAPIEDCGVDWSKVGRWWGVRYTENLPWSEVLGADGLTYREAAILMRYLRRYLKGQGVKVSGSLPGMSVYVNEPKRWIEVLDRLLS